MQLTRWDPFREMDDLSERLTRVLGTRLLRPVEPKGRMEEGLVNVDWAPLVDVEETDKEFLIKAELPEVRKEDVKVTIEDGVLSIEGERRQEKEEKGKTFHKVERGYGKFVRRFSLPTEVDGAKASAEFKEGVLNVHLPKAPNAKPKAIAVKVV